MKKLAGLYGALPENKRSEKLVARVIIREIRQLKWSEFRIKSTQSMVPIIDDTTTVIIGAWGNGS